MVQYNTMHTLQNIVFCIYIEIWELEVKWVHVVMCMHACMYLQSIVVVLADKKKTGVQE